MKTMESITLYIRDGSDEVTTVDIPVFDPRTDVIQWGSRFFAWQELSDKYCEVMVYAVPEDEEEKE